VAEKMVEKTTYRKIKKIGKRRYECTNLFSDGLTGAPRPLENNVAFVIQYIACSDEAKHLQWPV
jgi:hypothetical protein